MLNEEDCSQVDSTVITNMTYSDGSSEQYEKSATLNIKAEDVTVSMSQIPEMLRCGSAVTQYITTSFVHGAFSYFVYRPNQAVIVKTLHADGFLKDAEVELIYADDTASAELSADLDLSGYKGITEIKIKPASGSEAFTGTDSIENHISSSLTSKSFLYISG